MMAKNLVKCEPQPVHSHDYWWWYGDKFMTDDSLQSYLFNDVYGNYLANVPDDIEDASVELIDGVWYWVLDVNDPVYTSVESHNESIICPGCESVQVAEVLHTWPWYSYVHVCTECGYIVMESEWEKVGDEVPA